MADECLGSPNNFHTCLETEVRKSNAKSTIAALIGYQYQAKIYEGVRYHLALDTGAAVPFPLNVFSLNVRRLHENVEIEYVKMFRN